MAPKDDSPARPRACPVFSGKTADTTKLYGLVENQNKRQVGGAGSGGLAGLWHDEGETKGRRADGSTNVAPDGNVRDWPVSTANCSHDRSGVIEENHRRVTCRDPLGYFSASPHRTTTRNLLL